jgi:amino acid adenylation domain-containing protein
MLLEPFLRQCRLHPEAPALREGEREIGYGELLERSLAVAAALRRLGVGPGQRAAVFLERGIPAVTALFGVLLAGAAYVPLDLRNPAARLAFIARDAGASVLLGVGEPPDGWQGQTWLDVSACPAAAAPSPAAIETSDLAMILYTSGSTGRPKGVAMSHGAVAAFAEWAADLVDLCPSDRIAGSAPLFFDLSTFDLYAVLGRGASLHFVPAPLTLAPARLSAWLRDQAITGWYTVPSLLSFLAYKGNPAKTPLDALRFLIFAGEVLATPALLRLAEWLPHTALYNFFGPTETNVCGYWPVDRQRLDPAEAIPIGLPACGATLRIDEPDGELWVRGPTLLSGYWSEGRLHGALNEEGWYPTGDRVSRNARGEYLFHGRLGRMLKCSGYRVEPAEIEHALDALPGVRESAVVGLDDPTAGQRPAAVLTLAPPATLGEIRKALQLKLPAYMQPSRYLLVDALPRLGNGKVDYLRVRALLES